MGSGMISRRNCLASLAMLSAAACAGPGALNPRRQKEQRVEKMGVQLYTLREEMARDVPATLAAVAEAGYAEVETAGTGHLTPAQFAAALADAGLEAPSAHIPINVLNEQPDSALELASTIGYRYLVVPWLPPELRTLDGFKATAETLNRFGEQSARAGIQTAYHNHDFEFADIEGQQPFQLLLDACDPELVKFELDLYWSTHAGVDTAALLSNAPERFPLCHVKDRTANGDMVSVGDGEIDFPALFAAGTGLEHYFVEHDNPAEPLVSVQRSAAAVRQMRF